MANLIGYPYGESTSFDANRLYAGRFQADATGTVTALIWRSISAGNIKAGIYQDESGTPTNLLTANNSGTACSAIDWNEVVVPDLVIYAGQYYWLAAVASNSGVISGKNTDGTSRKILNAYSSGLPNPIGGGLTSGTETLSVYGDGTVGIGGTIIMMSPMI